MKREQMTEMEEVGKGKEGKGGAEAKREVHQRTADEWTADYMNAEKMLSRKKWEWNEGEGQTRTHWKKLRKGCEIKNELKVKGGREQQN